MNTYGLIGYPLGHSFSRRYFTDKFHAEGIDARYLNFEIPDISLIEKVLAENPDLRGFNITIPYKKSIMPYLDSVDAEAAAIGAVNVVKVNADGTLTGYNSDVYGFRESLRPMLEGYPHHKALVLGTGGASAAVVHALHELGLEVTRVSRTAGSDVIDYASLTPEIISAHTVLVNATPVGMSPATDAFPDIPYAGVGKNHVAFDLVYNPEHTMFMRKCAAAGAKVKNGLEMLHLQARRAWEIWNS